MWFELILPVETLATPPWAIFWGTKEVEKGFLSKVGHRNLGATIIDSQVVVVPCSINHWRCFWGRRVEQGVIFSLFSLDSVSIVKSLDAVVRSVNGIPSP